MQVQLSAEPGAEGAEVLPRQDLGAAEADRGIRHSSGRVRQEDWRGQSQIQYHAAGQYTIKPYPSSSEGVKHTGIKGIFYTREIPSQESEITCKQ